MRRRIPLIATIALALLVPGVLVVNGLRVLANDWYVHAAYGRPSFPPDRVGTLTDEQRIDLALVGLRSIQPAHEEGVQVLRQARLPDGAPAFGAREIAHMADVRRLVGGFYLAHVWSLAAMILLVVGLARTAATRRCIARGLLAGAALTLAIAAIIGLMMGVAFDWFFTSFHTVFFQGMTWYFYRGDTLLRIYPEVFWSDFGFVLGALALVQAAILGAGCWWWLRRTRRRGAPALQSAPIGEPGRRATV